ncbi:MAG: hypothetical protein ACRCYU_12295 [Nocardioides sp.]
MSTDIDTVDGGVTIKSGKGFEASWFTPKGTPEEIKAWLVAMFAFDESVTAELSPYEVAIMAEDVAQGRANVAQKLGGTLAVPQPRPQAENAWDQADGGPSGAAKAPKAPESTNDHQWLIDALNEATDEVALRRLWAANKAAFEVAEVKDAYVVRRDALKPAG